MRTIGLMLLLVWLDLGVWAAEYSSSCEDVAWEKVPGVRPEYTRSSDLLYNGVDSQGIVTACFERCRSLNCSAFIIDLEKSGCYSVETDSNEFTPEPTVTFYHQICLKVPESCLTTRYWQVERNLGAMLIDSMAKKLPQLVSRAVCYETCIDRGEDCKAAQFRTSKDLAIGDTIGSCSLLSVERGTKLQAYKASLYRDEYLENQCHNISKKDYCTYAEYRNSSMPYSDLKVDNLSPKECEQRCDESNDGFICRAYGVEYSSGNVPTCFLHSENTISAGLSALVTTPNSFFKEREPCIDMNVHCTNTTMTVKLRTSEPFEGRMYANGYSETCVVEGHGENITKLVLPLPDLTIDVDDAVMSCGLTPVYSVDQDNQTKTGVWVNVIVQYNPIIQRLGDQAVRVGCVIGDVPGPQNITVHSSYSFIDSNAGLPPVVSTVMNTSSEVPVVTMSVLDESLNRANVTNIGQKLTLKISMSPSDGPYDMWAGHLIASTISGDSSLLLLDDLGCNVTSVFPALGKDPSDNRSLIADFSAFKFPSSQHVRLNAIVRFCLESCEPTKCGDDYVSYGRKRRSIDDDPRATRANVTELHKKKPTNTSEELLLQTTFIVKEPRLENQDIVPIPLRAKDKPDTVIISGTDYLDGQFCMNSSLALFLLIFLLIIQIILIGSCVLAVRTYRRLAIRAEEDRADILARHLYGLHGGNFEISRRVHWADRNSSTLS